MSALTAVTAGHHEAGSVQEIVSYAAAQFDAARIRFPHSKMVRLIRRTHREDGAAYTFRMVDSFFDREQSRRDWAGFELHALGGYADPTGAHAAQNVDRARGHHA